MYNADNKSVAPAPDPLAVSSLASSSSSSYASSVTRSASSQASRHAPCKFFFRGCNSHTQISIDSKVKSVEPRNKFKDPVSAFLPRAIRAWADASTLVGWDFDHTQAARPSVLRGYVLPEPAIFITQKEDVMQEYLRMYLKLCSALMYRINRYGAVASVQGTNQWRALLGLTIHGGTRNDSRTARTRHVMAKELRKVNEDKTSGFVSDTLS